MEAIIVNLGQPSFRYAIQVREKPCCNNALVVVPLRQVVCLVLALKAVAVAFVSGPSLYGGMALSVFRFQDLLFIMKDCVHVMCEQDRRCG